MKITKKTNTELVESVITEADDVKIESPEIEDIDVAKDSADEIADKLADEVEEASDGELTLKDADAAAEEIKDVGEDVGAKTAVIVPRPDSPIATKNRLTDALDDAFKASKNFRSLHINEVPNVLISGLPGSSKTASVYNWAAGKVNILYVNAKNRDLGAFIDGYTVQDPNDPLHVTQATSSNLNGLDRPNSVLFLDEYNRQTNETVRASILTLINEHYVTGKENGGRHYFKNFLFTIVAINPAIGRADKGASALNDAEKSRFLYYVDNFDSDPETAADYFDKQYTALAKWFDAYGDLDEYEFEKKFAEQEDIVEPAIEKMNRLEAIETLLRIQDLGKFIVKHSDFEFDKKEDTDTLFNTGKKMLNQRALSSSIAAAGGDANVFRRWVDNNSGFLDDDIKMLDEILDDYTIPTREELFRHAGFEVKVSEEEAKVEAEAAKKAADEAAAEAAEVAEEEDDNEMFGGTEDKGRTISSPDAVVSGIMSDIEDLF